MRTYARLIQPLSSQLKEDFRLKWISLWSNKAFARFMISRRAIFTRSCCTHASAFKVFLDRSWPVIEWRAINNLTQPWKKCNFCPQEFRFWVISEFCADPEKVAFGPLRHWWGKGNHFTNIWCLRALDTAAVIIVKLRHLIELIFGTSGFFQDWSTSLLKLLYWRSKP